MVCSLRYYHGTEIMFSCFASNNGRGRGRPPYAGSCVELGVIVPQHGLDAMIEAVPANRLGRPEEITTAVLWLCGDMVSILHLKILVFCALSG